MSQQASLVRWTIRTRIVASFAVILVIMGMMGIVTSSLFSRMDQEAVSIRDDTMPGLLDSAKATRLWLLTYALLEQRISLPPSTRADALEAAMRAARADLKANFDGYAVTIHEDADRTIFNRVQAASEAYFRSFDRVLALVAAGDTAGARAERNGPLQAAFAASLDDMNELIDYNRSALEASVRLIAADTTRAGNTTLAAILAAVVAACVSGVLLFRSIVRPLRALTGTMEAIGRGDLSARLNLGRNDEFGQIAGGFNHMAGEISGLIGQVQRSGIVVNTSITEIAATARQQQATASEMAAITTEIGSTSKEIAATASDLVRTMAEVSSVAEHTAGLAGEGQAGLGRMEGSMHAVMAATGTINTRLAVLNDKATTINQVVTTITRVADQTNLLSLNAAIEAEKAGDYGRGFSVVATEIRRLADQTAVATYDIEQMVKEMQSAVSASVMGMDKFSEEVRRGIQEVEVVGGQLSEIIRQVQTLVPRFETVNEGVQAQATGAEQISQALVQLSDTAHQTLDSLRQSSQAIDELSQVALDLRNGIARFKLEM
ncbi:methyl-accepting chemotaxis protein [Pseudoxanthobacter sp.]|uniref:methyl-accepting chemotaxis protein n=1 Tax=Pseudoxanthobacter sp. TaxID=1925742 RepID=UPI002FDF3EE0